MWNWRRERAIESVILAISRRGLPRPRAALTCHLCMIALVDSKWGKSGSIVVVLDSHKAKRGAANVRLSSFGMLPDRQIRAADLPGCLQLCDSDTIVPKLQFILENGKPSVIQCLKSEMDVSQLDLVSLQLPVITGLTESQLSCSSI